MMGEKGKLLLQISNRKSKSSLHLEEGNSKRKKLMKNPKTATRGAVEFKVREKMKKNFTIQMMITKLHLR